VNSGEVLTSQKTRR